jgi:hypothetical protein
MKVAMLFGQKFFTVVVTTLVKEAAKKDIQYNKRSMEVIL